MEVQTMRLPAENASNAVRYTFARYVARRARRARLEAEENEVKAATAALKSAADFEDGAEQALPDIFADRDSFDDELDDIAKRHRQAIEGRATNANRERPYTAIYPDGIAWYTSAPLDQQKSRYELLVRRYAESLPDGDPVRAEGHLITEALEGWTQATEALGKAQMEVAVARAKTAQALEAWEATLNRLYFRLGEKLGKTRAERIFPKMRRGSRNDTDTPPGDRPIESPV